MSRQNQNILVEDSHAYAAAGGPDGRLWSTSTGLGHVLGDPDRVTSPEALLTQADVDRLADSVFAAQDDLAAALRGLKQGDDRFAHADVTHLGQVHNLFFSLLTKAVILDAWLKLPAPRVVIGSPELARVGDLSCLFGRYDHVFAALVDAMGKTASARLVETPSNPQSLFFDTFHHVPSFDKLFNLLNRTPGAIAYQLWRHMGAPRIGSGRRGTIFMVSDNEGIEEAFLKTVMAGWAIRPVSLKHVYADTESVPQSGLRALRDVWFGGPARLLSPDLAAASWRLAEARIESALAYHPGALRSMRSQARRISRCHGDTVKRTVVLGSGLYAPLQRLFDACLREVGVTVVCADHGTSLGLVRWHTPAGPIGISFSDLYLAFAPHGRSSYERAGTVPGQRIIAAGTPKVQSRSRWEALQRGLGRRRLGVRARESLLMYVAALSYNNHQPGNRSTTDYLYARFQAQLVSSLGSFRGCVAVKAYPSHRYVDPEQLWQMDLPANAVRAPFGEFRHIRWAADILLLDVISSTIGWAAATGRPLVLVNNPQHAFTEEAKAALRDVCFFIDATQPDWQAALADLLDQPVSDIYADWRERSRRRQDVFRHFLFGDPGGFADNLTSAIVEL